MTAADIDGDGKTDIVTTNSDNTVGVLLSLGNGTFAPEVTYAAGTKLSLVVALDLNGDGKPDLAVANSNSSGTVSVLLNLGNGTFSPAVSYAAGSYPSSVAAADFDGDGKPDLVVSNQIFSGTTNVLLNLGNGTFAAPVPHAVSATPLGVAAADLSGDGKPDLAVTLYDGVYSGKVAILLNLGNGTFAAPVEYNAGPYAGKIIAADLDGDGKLDLVTMNANMNASASSVSVLHNKGNGTFAPRVTYKVGTRPAGARPSAIATADLDGDGKLEIIVTNLHEQGFETSSMSVLVNQGNGTFAPAVEYVVGNYPFAMTAANLDGDGKPDLVVSNYFNKIVRVLRNLGNGTFAAPRIYNVGSALNSVTAVDLDGDGKPDLAGANGSSPPTVSVLLNQYGRSVPTHARPNNGSAHTHTETPRKQA
jgi:hypothetical protein